MGADSTPGPVFALPDPLHLSDVPPAIDGLLLEGPKLASGLMGGQGPDDARATHAWVAPNLYRIGWVLSISVVYLPLADEFVTSIRGTDGAMLVFGYTVGPANEEKGKMGPGQMALGSLLAHLQMSHRREQITAALAYEAGERTWTRAGFRDRPLELRKTR